jgi:hypothetical protein
MDYTSDDEYDDNSEVLTTTPAAVSFHNNPILAKIFPDWRDGPTSELFNDPFLRLIYESLSCRFAVPVECSQNFQQVLLDAGKLVGDKHRYDWIWAICSQHIDPTNKAKIKTVAAYESNYYKLANITACNTFKGAIKKYRKKVSKLSAEHPIYDGDTNISSDIINGLKSFTEETQLFKYYMLYWLTHSMVLINEGGSEYFLLKKKNPANGVITFDRVNRTLQSYKNKANQLAIKDKKSKPRTIASYIDANIDILSYNCDIFYPYAAHESQEVFDMLNERRAFNQFMPINSSTASDEGLPIILDHIRTVLAAGDEESYQYILGWLADLIQSPRDKKSIALIFRSEPGAGKTMFFSLFSQHCMRREYSKTIDTMAALTSQFNDYLANNLLIIADELASAGSGSYHAENDQLKSMISRDVMLKNSKGIKAVEVADYNRYVFLTNNKHSAVRIDSADRRYAVFECSNKYAPAASLMSKQEIIGYFERLRQAFITSGPAFAQYLDNRTEKWQYMAIPATNIRKTLQSATIPAEMRFFHECFIEGRDEFNDDIELANDELFNSFRNWCMNNGENSKFTSSNLAKALIGGFGDLAEKQGRKRINGVQKSFVKFHLSGISRMMSSKYGLDDPLMLETA